MNKKIFMVLMLSVTAFLYSGEIWVETSQSDFADGCFERNICSSNHGGGVLKFIPNFDANGDGYVDLFISNRLSHCSYIYWGSESGYSTSHRTTYPYAGTGGNCDAADLNGDGYPEFVCSPLECNGLYIYWGSASGPNPSNPTILQIASNWNESMYLVDLNKDGYIDIITGNCYNHQASIFWGSATGYSASNSTQLPTLSGQHNIEVADLNKDNWLDLVFPNDDATNIYIYWGSATGYSPGSMQVLATSGAPHGSSVGDLNSDGYLDLVLTTRENDAAYIYYGSASGYSGHVELNPGQGNGSGYGGSSIADLNSDGFLDIVFFTVGHPMIYWGSATGFSDANRLQMPITTWAVGGFVCDLNGDTYLDVMVGNWGWDGITYIVWGPTYTSYQALGADFDHHGMFREIGNIYNRAYYEDYGSSVFNAGKEANWNTIEWDAAAPVGASVLFWLRSGDTPVPDGSWSEWIQIENGGSIPEHLNAQYLQYRARLAYLNPSYLPTLEEVRISYSTEPTPIVAVVRIEPEVINLKSQGTFTTFIKLLEVNHGLIKQSTIECEGAHAVKGIATPEFYIAKFRIQDLVGVVPGNAVEFMVTGELNNGIPFAGCDTVRVIGHDVITLTCNPNPFKYNTTIYFQCEDLKNATIRIYSMDGRFIRTFSDLEYNLNIVTAVWDGKDSSGRLVPAGMYVLHVSNGGLSSMKKLIMLQ